MVRGNKSSGNSHHRQASNSDFDPDTLITDIINSSSNNHLKYAGSSIMSLNKDNTKDLYLFTIKSLENSKYNTTFTEYFMFMIKDICLFKLQC